MSDGDGVLALVDDLARALTDSVATRIEVEADDFAVTLTRDPAAARPAATAPRAPREPSVERTQRVHATAVGIFSAAKEWSAGDTVGRGAVLGAIQSLGHMAEITAPADGTIREVLVAGGAPVEYGQPLFAIALAP
ncbi:MAG: acetyl-CoA carboxylase biotin carboxyl carrier protein [Candidatus Limnocylindria bacterium]